MLHLTLHSRGALAVAVAAEPSVMRCSPRIRPMAALARPFAKIARPPAIATFHPAAAVRQFHQSTSKRALQETPTQPPEGKVNVFLHADELEFSRYDRPSRRLPLLWLRDSCRCPKCVDPHSGQKNFSTTDLPDIPVAKSAKISDTTGTLTITWADDGVTGGGDHKSTFSAEEMEPWFIPRKRLPMNFPYHFQRPRFHTWDRRKFQGWMKGGRCVVSYDKWLGDDRVFEQGLQDLAETGLIFVKGVPDEQTAVERIGERIGMLQTTFYGTTWDVVSKPQAENVAYTSQFLGLHQDLMYHSPIPKLQLLHCLANECEGGESLFSDGARAAYEMSLRFPAEFRDLTSLLVDYVYDKGGHFYYQRQNTIHLEHDLSIKAIHWAPPFQGIFTRPLRVQDDRASEFLIRWKDAATKFQRILESPDNMFELKMNPGECVIFDNTRVLHGRRQFTPGGGKRWLKGTYIAPQVVQGKIRQVLGAGTDIKADLRAVEESEVALELRERGVSFPLQNATPEVRDIMAKLERAG